MFIRLSVLVKNPLHEDEASVDGARRQSPAFHATLPYVERTWLQALAASLPLSSKWLRKKARCASFSWKVCGVSTTESTGTPVSSCTCISAETTVPATKSCR